MSRPDADRPGDPAPSEACAPSDAGTPTRRRLLALLSGLPAIGAGLASPGRGEAGAVHPGALHDPTPRLMAEFQALLARHEAALALCDRLEAELLARIGYPRVALPAEADGPARYAANMATLAQVVPPGRRRDRLERALRHRQLCWDRQARASGLSAAQDREAALDRAVAAAADELLTSPAWTLAAALRKLVVLIATQEPGPSAGWTSPWRELRGLLADLSGLAARQGDAP